MSEFYILGGPDGHEVLPVADVLTWARFFEGSNRRVAEDVIGGVRISTVFLGMNHRFFGKGPPLVFETMAFHPEPKRAPEITGFGIEITAFGVPMLYHEEMAMERCSTWAEAEEQHARMVAEYRRALNG